MFLSNEDNRREEASLTLPTSFRARISATFGERQLPQQTRLTGPRMSPQRQQSNTVFLDGIGMSGASQHRIDRRKIVIMVQCPLCGKMLSRNSNLRRHLSEVHGGLSRNEKAAVMKRIDESGDRETCPVCQESLESPTELFVHARHNHNFHGDIQKKTFANYEEFEKWKETMEVQYATVWNRKNQTTKSNMCYQYFRCHRATTSQRRLSLKRRLRMREKVYRSCTSFMNVKTDVTGITNVEFCLEHLGHGHMTEYRAYEDEEISSESLGTTDSPGRMEDSIEEPDEGIERLYWTASEDIRHVIGGKLKAINDECSKLQGQGSKEAYHCLRKIDDILSKALGIVSGTKEPNDFHELHSRQNIEEQETTKQAITSESRSEMEPKETEARTSPHHVQATSDCDTNDSDIAIICDVCGIMESVVCEFGVRKAMIDWMLCDDCGAWVHMSCAKTRECFSCKEGYLELDHPEVIAKKRSEN